MSDASLDQANRVTWARLNTEDYFRIVAQYIRKETMKLTGNASALRLETSQANDLFRLQVEEILKMDLSSDEAIREIRKSLQAAQKRLSDAARAFRGDPRYYGIDLPCGHTVYGTDSGIDSSIRKHSDYCEQAQTIADQQKNGTGNVSANDEKDTM